QKFHRLQRRRVQLLVTVVALPLSFPRLRNVPVTAFLRPPPTQLFHFPPQPLPEFPPTTPHPLRTPRSLRYSHQPLHLRQALLHSPLARCRLPLPSRLCCLRRVQPQRPPLRLRRTGSPPDKSCPPSSRRFPESPSTAPASSPEVSRHW